MTPSVAGSSEQAGDAGHPAPMDDPAGREEARTGGGLRDVLARMRSVLRRNRVLGLVAAVACLALVAGLFAGRALAPALEPVARAGLITAPVQWGQLRSELVFRADAAYADPVEVTVDTAALAGAAIVSGRVPTVGTELTTLSVALEVNGRPLIVLPGDVRAYRTLRVGLSGPDVAQLKAALRAVELDGGDPSDPAYTEQTAQAVGALYERVGYAPPEAEAEDDASTALRTARAAVADAEATVTAARNDLRTAGAGPGAAEIVAADNAVASAHRALDAARAQSPADTTLIADLQDALTLARTQREELAAAPDTTSQRLALAGAERALATARDEAERARLAALPTLPAQEVLFLSDLPRRVDAVTVGPGAAATGTAMTVSGSVLDLQASLPEVDARLLAIGTEASIELPDGSEVRAAVEAAEPAEGAEAGGGWDVRLSPVELTDPQREQMSGQNLRVRVAVGATDGDVLSVPAAALTAGSGGQTRVEVVDGDPATGDEVRRHLVTVTTGLATPEGVEVTPSDGELRAGDLVVVGR